MRLSLLHFLAAAAVVTTASGASSSVELTTPADGSGWAFTSNSLRVGAKALDADGPVARVDFYLDDLLLGSDTTPVPGTLGHFEAYLTPRPAPGTYMLTAKAHAGDGEAVVSAARTITVAPPPPAPAIRYGALGVGSKEVSVAATVNGYGNSLTARDVWIEFGLSENYGGSTRNAGGAVDAKPGSTEYEYRGSLSNLERNTAYHYRIVAQSQGGITYGPDATFTTLPNQPPVSYGGSAAVSGPGPVEVFVDILDPEYDPITFTAVTQPAHGQAALDFSQPGGRVLYTPGATFTVEDVFTCTARDSYGAEVTARVWVSNLRRGAPGYYVLTVVDDFTMRPAGVVALSVTRARSFSGVLHFFGQRLPLRGRFSRDGQFQTELSRRGQQPLSFYLSEAAGANGVAIGGMIDGRYFIEGGYRLVFPENAEEAGAYTMALPAGHPDAPQGDGYVVGKVSRHGRVVFTGRIGDGQAFSFGTQLRRGGTAELFVTAGDAPRDRIHGRLQFPGAESSEATGSLYWYKAPRTSGYFQAGFLTSIQVTGSRLVLSAEEDQILDYSTEAAGMDIHFEDFEGNLLFDGGFSGTEDDLSFEDTSTLRGSTRAVRAVKAPAPPVTLKVNRATGRFTGTYRDAAANGTLRSFSGVLLQSKNAGTGLVNLGGRTGRVTLKPR